MAFGKIQSPFYEYREINVGFQYQKAKSLQNSPNSHFMRIIEALSKLQIFSRIR